MDQLKDSQLELARQVPARQELGWQLELAMEEELQWLELAEVVVHLGLAEVAEVVLQQVVRLMVDCRPSSN